MAKRSPDVVLNPGDLARVIYVDHFGNCMTGIRAESLPRNAQALVGKRKLRNARTFEEAPSAFWYENSLGLVEIAVPRGSAARTLRLRIGYPIRTVR